MKRILKTPLTYILLVSTVLLYPLSYSDLTESEFVEDRNPIQYVPVGWTTIDRIGWSSCVAYSEPYQFTGFPLYTYEYSLTGNENCDRVRLANPLAFALNGSIYMAGLSAGYVMKRGVSFTLAGAWSDDSSQDTSGEVPDFKLNGEGTSHEQKKKKKSKRREPDTFVRS